MGLDVIEIHRLGDAGQLEDVANIPGNIRVILEPLPVTLEVAVVDGIETYQCGEQANVRLGQDFTQQIAIVCKVRIDICWVKSSR